MWLCLNRAFLSIVTPSAAEPDSAMLLVRARRKGDIESVFPRAIVTHTPHRDYLFRALVAREDVACAVQSEVMGVDYSNFKNSVEDNRLHDAYADVWGIMADLQPTAPYSGMPRGAKR